MIPVVVFAYNRPRHLQRTLECLRRERVPRLYAFSDGPRTPAMSDRVAEVRGVLRGIDWCEVSVVERPENMGLGKSVIAGVSRVLATHEAALVLEDDLYCVEGTYAYLCAALTRYASDDRVTSITGWTHPRVTPKDVTNQPYFDGRGESWSWGTWARAWRGMDTDAVSLLRQCRERGTDPTAYGHDLIAMAETEAERNLWAVRFVLLQILRGGLCMRPPHSLIENIGFDEAATNTSFDDGWSNPPLRPCPAIPSVWPEPIEHPDCARLWARAYPGAPPPQRGLVRRAVSLLRGLARAARR